MGKKNATVGNYKGTMPEDIYASIGDIWESNGKPLEITSKTYIVDVNSDYDIELLSSDADNSNEGFTKIMKAAQGKNSAPFQLPDIPNLVPDTKQYLLTIAIGDLLLVPNMYRRKIMSKTFSQDGRGLISIHVTYDK